MTHPEESRKYTVVAGQKVEQLDMDRFESEPMDLVGAYRYAQTLRSLGNVQVWVRIPE